MAKEKERKIARFYFTEKGLNAKETAEKTGVSEKTIALWAEKENWKEIRNAKETSSDALVSNLRELLDKLIDDRKVLSNTDENYEKSRARLSDEISKTSKAIENARNDGKPSFATYLWSIETFMDELLTYDPKLYQSLIDFQELHISTMATRL